MYLYAFVNADNLNNLQINPNVNHKILERYFSPTSDIL